MAAGDLDPGSFELRNSPPPAVGTAGLVDKAAAAAAKADGNRKLRAGDNPGAIAAYSEAIALNPTDAVFWANRAAGYNAIQGAKNFKLAVTDCEKAIALDPGYAKAYSRLGLALWNLGRFQEATEAYCKEAEQLKAATEQLKAAAAQHKEVAVAGFVQGVKYLSTRPRVVDLSAPEFGAVTPAQIHRIVSHCTDLEALFLPEGTTLDEPTLGALREICPRALCLALGCEVTKEGYDALRAQHGKHDAELAAALVQLGLSGVVPSGIEPEPEPEPEELEPEPEEPEPARTFGTSNTREYDKTAVSLRAFLGPWYVDLRAHLTKLGAETTEDLLELGPEHIDALASNLRVIQATKFRKALAELATSAASSAPAAGGAAGGSAQHTFGTSNFKRRTKPEPQPADGTIPVEPEPEPDGSSPCRVLDLTSSRFGGLTDAGLAEIPKLCPDVTAVFLPSDSKVTPAGLKEFRRQSPGVRCLSLGAEVARSPLLHALREAGNGCGSSSRRLNLCWSDKEEGPGEIPLRFLTAADGQPLGRDSAVEGTTAVLVDATAGAAALKEAWVEVFMKIAMGEEHRKCGASGAEVSFGDWWMGEWTDADETPPTMCDAEYQKLSDDGRRPYRRIGSEDVLRAAATENVESDAMQEHIRSELNRLAPFWGRAVRLNGGVEEDDGIDCVGVSLRCFERLTDAGLAELAALCPEVEAVFTPLVGESSKITAAGRAALKAACSRVKCVDLGCEISASAYDALLAEYAATQTLGLTGQAHAQLTDAGLREMSAICQLADGQQLRAVIFPEELERTSAVGLAVLQSLYPCAQFVCVGDEVRLLVRDEAVEAKAHMDASQEQLRSAPAAAAAEPEARDAARLVFIAAAEAFSAALAEGSPLYRHVARLTGPPGPPGWRPEQQLVSKWGRVQAEAKQLAVLAAECKRVVEASEPARSTQRLADLQDKDRSYRLAMETSRARIVIAGGVATSSPQGGQALSRTQTTPEQMQAKGGLLNWPIGGWSAAQVQEWIGLLGLPPDGTAAVQKALAADDTDGEDLEGYDTRQLTKRLKKSRVDNAAELAEQTMALHEEALGGAPSQGKLMAAQADLAEARKALRDNRVAMRAQVVHLVSLASQHFPELRHVNEDVQKFMGTDGLAAADNRRLADYDDRQPLVNGRNALLRATYDGVDVCLKEFRVQGDMQAYTREFLRVRRLHHPYIITYTAAFEDSGSMFLEMEFYKHGSLRHWLETSQPDAAQKRSVLRQTLLALACVHSQGIVHSDIKGENVLIADDGSPRICDFEMSKDLDTVSVSIAAGGGGFTPGFMCPRVLRGVEKLSPAADMYAFGVLILNTIHPPAAGQVYPLKDTAKLTDPALKDLVPKLLSDDPKARPTALQLQAEPYFASDQVDEWGRVDMSLTQSVKSCRQELLDADSAALQVPDIANVIAEIDARMLAHDALDETAKDHRFAIYMYTIESRAYPRFNDSLRERPPGILFDAWSSFLWHLMAALRALPDDTRTVYRGIHDPPNQSSYIKSSKIHWSGFSSTSVDPAVARRFASGGVIFVLDVRNAKDIQPFSWLGSEEGELLLSPNMEFLVTKELHEPTEGPLRGCRVIEMQQIPDDTLWS